MIYHKAGVQSWTRDLPTKFRIKYLIPALKYSVKFKGLWQSIKSRVTKFKVTLHFAAHGSFSRGNCTKSNWPWISSLRVTGGQGWRNSLGSRKHLFLFFTSFPQRIPHVSTPRAVLALANWRNCGQSFPGTTTWRNPSIAGAVREKEKNLRPWGTASPSRPQSWQPYESNAKPLGSPQLQAVSGDLILMAEEKGLQRLFANLWPQPSGVCCFKKREDALIIQVKTKRNYYLSFWAIQE